MTPLPGDEVPMGKEFEHLEFLPAGSLDFDFSRWKPRTLVPWWKRPLFALRTWVASRRGQR